MTVHIQGWAAAILTKMTASDLATPFCGNIFQTNQNSYIISKTALQRLPAAPIIFMRTPGAYVDSVRDEIADLRARYNIYMENRKNYKEMLDFYKRDMIRNYFHTTKAKLGKANKILVYSFWFYNKFLAAFRYRARKLEVALAYKEMLDFYKRDMIRNNPNMSSGEFKEAFEELKNAVADKKEFAGPKFPLLLLLCLFLIVKSNNNIKPFLHMFQFLFGLLHFRQYCSDLFGRLCRRYGAGIYNGCSYGIAVPHPILGLFP